MTLTLGFSPCPNDTFIFDALVHNKLDTGELRFDPFLADVETLNEWAIEGKLDITKLSFPAFFRAKEDYLLLNAGSALGKGVGPLVIKKQEAPISDDEVNNFLIVLPGEHTTAHLLFSMAYPRAKNKTFMRFDLIEDYVSGNPGSLGVIIHENRFTYEEKGLFKHIDLGDYWEEKMHVPIPLGGIAINQSVKRSVALEVDKLIRNSIEYAFNNYPVIPDYVKKHSQAMSPEIMRKHIDLYVNQYSLTLGKSGRDAIKTMYKSFQTLHGQDSADEVFLFL